MGLDMYLSRKKYVGAKWEHRNVTGSIDIIQNGKQIPIDFKKVSYIQEEVGYWRKANAIHKWFVDNCQDGNDDCREYYVSIDQLKNLHDICQKIKQEVKLEKGKIKNGMRMTENGWEPIMEDGEYISNPEICKELLPTEDGCFFGSTDYDEYYLSDINNTIELLEEIIKEEEEMNKNGIYNEYYYTSSW